MKVFNCDKGFTILETMVAVAILAVGTLGVGSMLMLSFSSGRQAAETRRAETLAVQRLEALKATQGTLPAGSYLSTNDYSTANPSQSRWPDPTFVCRWDVSNYQWLDTSMNAGLSQIDITLGWPTGAAYPACTAANPENCKYRFAVSTYFRPLPGP